MTVDPVAPVRTLAVLDEGEPVARLVSAVADLARADGPAIATVVAHVGPAPWFGREADELLDLGESGDPGEGADFTEHVVAVLLAAGVDTVWPGHLITRRTDLAGFVEACIEAGLRVAGPLPATLRRLRDLDEVAAALDLPRSTAAEAGSRLVEIDVVADGVGVLTLPPRDVVATESDHLILAEYPAAGLPDETAAALEAAVHRLVTELGYLGGAAVRFRVGSDGSIGLVDIDVLARPEQTLLDEALSSLLVQQRVQMLAGRPLPAHLPSEPGHAVAVTVLARSLSHADTHVVRLLDLPAGVGVRADVSPRVGDRVDDVVTTIGAWGRDRAQAMQRLTRALERTTVVLEGAVTNRSDLLRLLARPEVSAGPVEETWYAERVATGDLVPEADPIALVAAAVESYQAEFASVRAAFLASAARGRPGRPEDVGTRFTLDYRGEDHVVVVERRSSTRYRVAVTRDGRTVEVDALVDVLGEYERRLTCAGRKYRVVAAERGASIRLEIDGLAHTLVREDGMAVRTERPALVADLHVAVGDEVHVGQPVATLESMKMLSTVTSPHEGVVTSVAVLPNTQVERGATLLRVRGEVSAGQARGAAAAVDLSALDVDAASEAVPHTAAGVYRRLRDYLLGYDLAPASLAALLAEQKATGSAEGELLEVEDSLLDVYADLAALYRPRTEGDLWHDVDVDTLADTGDTQEYFLAFLQWMDPDRAGLPESYRRRLERALARYGVDDLAPGPELDEATLWMYRSFSRVPALSGAITTILERRLRAADSVRPLLGAGARSRLERLARSAEGRAPGVAALARDLAFTLFEEPALAASVDRARRPMLDILDALAENGGDAAGKQEAVDALVAYPYPLRAQMLQSWFDSDPGDVDLREVLLTAALLRYYRQYDLRDVTTATYDGVSVAFADYDVEGRRVHLVTTFSSLLEVYDLGTTVRAHLEDVGLLSGPEAEATDVVVGVLSWRRSPIKTFEELVATAREGLERAEVGRLVGRFDLTVTSRTGTGKEHTRTQHVSFTQDGAGAWLEMPIYRNLHPSMAERLGIWRLENFDLERLASPEEVYLFLGVAKDNPSDRRLFALVEARDLTRVENEEGRASYPGLERLGLESLAAMRSALATFPPRQRPAMNRLFMVVRPPFTVPPQEWVGLTRTYEPLARGVGLEKLAVHVSLPGAAGPEEKVILVEGLGGRGLAARIEDPRPHPVRPLTAYAQKVLTAQRFGAPYPYEIVRMLTPRAGERSSFPTGDFVELDLDGDRLVPVDREPAQNSAHLVVGLLTTYTDVVPEGMMRVAILSDPTQGLGNLAEPECARINAALDHAAEHQVPVEWYAVSSGALIALDSGTENMDWISLTLRRIIEFTQAGGEINIIVTGINVGGQPYWNAEATMLMHTKGILVMTPASQMVLTGKQALDFSGAVSAEDNHGIGGYDRIMGPNGQAQYWAPSFEDACRLLLQHYDYTYVVPGERFPRRRPTTDTPDRDVRTSPHALIPSSPFTTVGEVFENNPERKMPFDMRSVMRAVADVDDQPLERWKLWRDSDTSIVWDATIGGIPVCLLGLESHAVPRSGFVPSDGPPAWTSGTLFPQASRKTARAINAASGNRPLVVLANLSGFDGSPESMRNWQLEYGAEIGRAVTNFDGPIVFVVVSRYHGGAFVVFSKKLNDHMEIAAVEGSHASVIGGAPAAATVFAREVRKRTMADPRVVAATEAANSAVGSEVGRARAELVDLTARVRSEKLGEMADEFDAIHSVERARSVGSVDHIIAARDLRPWIITALERRMADFT